MSETTPANTPPQTPEPKPASSTPQASMWHHRTRTYYDTIAQEARVTTARLLPHDRPLTPAEIREVAGDLKAFIKERDQSNSWFARQLGLSASVISEFIGGTYAAQDQDELARKVNARIGVLVSAEKVRVPRQFVPTRVATRILAAIKLAHDHRKFALIVGDSGYGKTITARAAQARFPGAIYLRINAHTRNSSSVARALLDQLAPRLPHANVYRHLIGRLKGSDRVLLIDESHLLSASGRQVLRDILDEAEVGIALLGNEDITKIVEAERGSRRGQFVSRCIVRLNLDLVAQEGDGGEPLFTVDDVMRVFEHSKVRLAGDAAELLSQLASSPGNGGLRLAEIIISAATSHPDLISKVIGVKQIRSILRETDPLLYHQVRAMTEAPAPSRRAASA
jgi:DNA transposition AAA+ family ATPase